jgi:hypothetical protein
MTVASENPNLVVKEYPVLKDHAEGLDAYIEKLNKKCRKYGVPEITVEKGKLRAHEAFKDYKGKTITRVFEVIDYKISYEHIGVSGGWKVIASIERSDGGIVNVINGFIEKVGNLATYDLNTCDHCGINRYRKKVVVLENEAGEKKVVGSTCIKDYLGIDPTGLLFSISLQDALNSFFSDYNYSGGGDFDEEDYMFGGGGYNHSNRQVQGCVEKIVAVLREDGWGYIKRQRNEYTDEYEYETGNCTVDKVNRIYSTLYSPAITRAEIGAQQEVLDFLNEHGEENEEIAKNFIEKMKEEYTLEKLTSGDLSSFDFSFGSLINSDGIPEKSENMFIGMVGYRLAKEIKKEKAKAEMVDADGNPLDRSKSEYVYEEGEKVIGVELELDRTVAVESEWGSSLLVAGRVAGTQNQVVAFCSGKTDFLYEEDNSLKKKILASFTVKYHSEKSNFGKQTTVTRLRLAKIKKPKAKKSAKTADPIEEPTLYIP